MIFDGVTSKSPVQLAVEAMLIKPAARTDASARRERTIAAMILECAENGYGETKVIEVARRAKVSTATVYRDFTDRDGLLRAAVETIVPLFGLNWLEVPETSDPLERIECMLLAHGRALADPFMGWLFRLYVHLAHSTTPQLMTLARMARDTNLAVWVKEIARLEKDGHLVPTDHAMTAGILLGAIERRTIFARMAFGENDDGGPSFRDVAGFTAKALFRVYGKSRPQTHRPPIPEPIALMEFPSPRLRAYGERLLEQDIGRVDARGRRTRIQFAAMMECVEYGYEAATMASVATRAGVSTATLYLDYQDKPAMFLDAIIVQSRFRVDYQGLIDAKQSMEASIVSLVYSLSYVLSDPDFLWFHRVSMASEISHSPELIASSRRTRAYTEHFWMEWFKQLQSQGKLQACDLPLVINLLLGATQRRSVLSMIFFGVEDVSADDIARHARASTEFVLRLIGVPTS